MVETPINLSRQLANEIHNSWPFSEKLHQHVVKRATLDMSQKKKICQHADKYSKRCLQVTFSILFPTINQTYVSDLQENCSVQSVKRRNTRLQLVLKKTPVGLKFGCFLKFPFLKLDFVDQNGQVQTVVFFSTPWAIPQERLWNLELCFETPENPKDVAI